MFYFDYVDVEETTNTNRTIFEPKPTSTITTTTTTTITTTTTTTTTTTQDYCLQLVAQKIWSLSLRKQRSYDNFNDFANL